MKVHVFLGSDIGRRWFTPLATALLEARRRLDLADPHTREISIGGSPVITSREYVSGNEYDDPAHAAAVARRWTTAVERLDPSEPRDHVLVQLRHSNRVVVLEGPTSTPDDEAKVIRVATMLAHLTRGLVAVDGRGFWTGLPEVVGKPFYDSGPVFLPFEDEVEDVPHPRRASTNPGLQ